MKKASAAHRAVAAALTGMMALGSVAPAVATELGAQDKEKVGKYVQRLYGEDRYETMAEVVKRTFEESDPDAIVVASGTSFADALAANALAGFWSAPLVLTDGNALSEDAADVIEDNTSSNLEKIFVMGGTAAISDAVVDEIVAIEGVKAGMIERLDGDDRIETSLKVANEIATPSALTDLTAIVATGADFADALSISSLSYDAAVPIILTDASGNLSMITKRALEGAEEDYEYLQKYNDFIIVGGEAAVSEDTEDYLKDYLKDKGQSTPQVVRWDGKDRYATSEEIAINLAKWDYSWAGSVLATGKNYADALAGGQYAGKAQSMVLLADDVKDPTVDTLVDNADEDFVEYKITVVGGEKAFSAELATAINDLIDEELDD